jgi:hypothetical protein
MSLWLFTRLPMAACSPTVTKGIFPESLGRQARGDSLGTSTPSRPAPHRSRLSTNTVFYGDRNEPASTSGDREAAGA